METCDNYLDVVFAVANELERRGLVIHAHDLKHSTVILGKRPLISRYVNHVYPKVVKYKIKKVKRMYLMMGVDVDQVTQPDRWLSFSDVQIILKEIRGSVDRDSLYELAAKKFTEVWQRDIANQVFWRPTKGTDTVL